MSFFPKILNKPFFDSKMLSHTDATEPDPDEWISIGDNRIVDFKWALKQNYEDEHDTATGYHKIPYVIEVPDYLYLNRDALFSYANPNDWTDDSGSYVLVPDGTIVYVTILGVREEMHQMVNGDWKITVLSKTIEASIITWLNEDGWFLFGYEPEDFSHYDYRYNAEWFMYMHIDIWTDSWLTCDIDKNSGSWDAFIVDQVIYEWNQHDIGVTSGMLNGATPSIAIIQFEANVAEVYAPGTKDDESKILLPDKNSWFFRKEGSSLPVEKCICVSEGKHRDEFGNYQVQWNSDNPNYFSYKDIKQIIFVPLNNGKFEFRSYNAYTGIFRMKLLGYIG